MLRHFEEIARFEREGFDVILEKTWEDTHPRDCFDDTCYDIREMCEDIDRGRYEWFVLRVSIQLRGRSLAEEYLGGLLYEDAREVLSDGTAEDLIYVALERARKEALVLKGLLDDLFLEETV